MPKPSLLCVLLALSVVIFVCFNIHILSRERIGSPSTSFAWLPISSSSADAENRRVPRTRCESAKTILKGSLVEGELLEDGCARNQVLQHILDLQFSDKGDMCDDVYVINNNHAAAGLGSQIHVLLRHVSAALLAEKPMVLMGTSVYTTNAACIAANRGNLGCYIQPLSRCDQQNLTASHTQTWHNATQSAEIHLIWINRMKEMFPSLQSKGSLFFTSILMEYFLRPSAVLENALAEVRDDIKMVGGRSLFSMRYLGVHVRGTDKQFQINKKVDLSSIVEKTVSIIKVSGIETVYLSSDVRDAGRVFHVALRNIGVPLYEMEQTKYFGRFNLSVADRKGTHEILKSSSEWAVDEGANMLVNMILLGSGAAFIGSLNSNIGRVSHELLAMRYLGKTPLVPSFDLYSDVYFFGSYEKQLR